MMRPPHRFQYIQTYVFHIHMTQSVSILDPTMHLNIDSSWICFPRGPEDDLIKVQTFRPDNILFLLYGGGGVSRGNIAQHTKRDENKYLER